MAALHWRWGTNSALLTLSRYGRCVCCHNGVPDALEKNAPTHSHALRHASPSLPIYQSETDTIEKTSSSAPSGTADAAAAAAAAEFFAPFGMRGSEPAPLISICVRTEAAVEIEMGMPADATALEIERQLEQMHPMYCAARQYLVQHR